MINLIPQYAGKKKPESLVGDPGLPNRFKVGSF
jgi:hypothetical protein